MELVGYAIALVLLIALIERTREMKKLKAEHAKKLTAAGEKAGLLRRYVIRLLFDCDYYDHEVETIRIAVQQGSFNLDLVDKLAAVSESECGDPNSECIKKELKELNPESDKIRSLRERLQAAGR